MDNMEFKLLNSKLGDLRIENTQLINKLYENQKEIDKINAIIIRKFEDQFICDEKVVEKFVEKFKT